METRQGLFWDVRAGRVPPPPAAEGELVATAAATALIQTVPG
jgi:hypothetical protein